MLARATGSLKIPLSLTAQIGEENKYTAEATGFAINGSAVGVNIDDMIAQTESTANIHGRQRNLRRGHDAKCNRAE